ncbi:MAG TPA: proton-conducting transporter membrane subunit [Anaerolineae bacterium]|nr:proton-conducting transporter membrane subunit [Anaerolineae bacterium]
MNTFGIAPLILIFPIIGVLFNGLAGRRFIEHDREIGERWSGWFASAMALMSFAIAVSLFFVLRGNEYHAETITLFDWFNIQIASWGMNFHIPWAIQVDTLSVTMMLVVTGVGSLIHIYAIGYMHGDANFSRFFTYLNLFLFFMLILITGNNYMMLFVGWEGVGLCSFLLIGFWFEQTDEKGSAVNVDAARKAFVANRVGDLAMILAMSLTFWTFGSLTFDTVFAEALAHAGDDPGAAVVYLPWMFEEESEAIEPAVAITHDEMMTDDHGEAVDDHGEAIDDHGEAMDDHGEATDDHGEAVDDHGEAMDDHGEATDDHGESKGHYTPVPVDHQHASGGLGISLGAMLTAITALFLIGATGKSAQIPLFVWLPDAMAGPTPVSALIHAATMVTSGIYLIVRSNVLFELVRESGYEMFGLISSPTLVAYVGAFTAVYAGLIAFTQFDIKKVLAYSTVSQLGFMIAAVGMGAYVAGMFHLITHAFFKALLFMGSGSVIHGMEHGHHDLHGHGHGDDDHDEDAHGDEHHAEAHGDHFDPQDMRTMGGLREQMPITFAVYMVGALALAGIFPLAGFWSKDEILAHASSNGFHPDGWQFEFIGVYALLSIAAVCTAFYMGRQLKMVFFGEPRHEAAKHAHESPPTMTYPLIVLAGLSIFGGMVLNLPYLFGEHDHAEGFYLMLEQWLHHSITSFSLTEAGIVHMPHTPLTLSYMVAGLSTILAVGAILGAFYGLYGNRPQTADEKDPLESTPIWWMAVLPLNTLYMDYLVPVFNRVADWTAFRLDWEIWHDMVHDKLIRDPFVGASKVASEIWDRKGVDGVVNGVGRVANWLSGVMRLSQTGFVRNYALSVFLGVVLLLAYFWLMAS